MVDGGLVRYATVHGHSDVVTAVSFPRDTLVSSSRDKSVLVWKLSGDAGAVPHRRLTGHSNFVQDVVVSADDQYAISGSWDGDLRLWNLNAGVTTKRFAGHTKDVLSVSFSPDDRLIFSAGRDHVIKLWNTLGVCKYTINAHTEWVSCVRVSPDLYDFPVVVSGSWDRTVKVWSVTTCKLIYTMKGHTGYVNAVAFSPDGAIFASGGKDKVVMLWSLTEGRRVYELNAGAIIHALCCSPKRYWLCAATEDGVQIWDMEKKSLFQVLRPEKREKTAYKNKTYCTSLTWSADGCTLFTGYNDGTIRLWGFARA